MDPLLDRLDPGDQKRLRRAAMPAFTPPMLATLTKQVFSDPAWVYEPKLDGQRSLRLAPSRAQVAPPRGPRLRRSHPLLGASRPGRGVGVPGRMREGVGGPRREASCVSLRACSVQGLAQVQVQQRTGVHRDRVDRTPWGTLRVGGAARGLPRGW